MFSTKENELIELLRKGDRASFSTLYELYKDKVFVFAFVHTRSRQTAEEITQDVFLKLWEKRGQIAIEHNFTAYIRKVTFNRIKDYFRSEEATRRMRTSYIYIKELEINETVDGVTGKELSVYYREAVRRLPAQRKMVYVLNKEYGLSYKEIATKLSISVFTVRNQLAQSVKFIRNHLAACSN